MVQCWNPDPTERPAFSELVKGLSHYLGSMAGYLHVGTFDQQPTIQTVYIHMHNRNQSESISESMILPF